MKLYCYYTSAYEVLLQEWFLPSLKDDYTVILKRDDYGESCVMYKDKGWHHITREKTNFIISAIKDTWGDIFVFTDPDTQFFKETKQIVLRLSKHNDLVFQRDNPQGVLCSGFFACRANKKTLRLWEDIRNYIGTNGSDDQDSLNHLLLSGPFFRHWSARKRIMLSRWGVNTYRIPWGYFPAEFYGAGALTGTVWQPGMALSIPESIRMHHANYARGINDKIAQLRFVRNIIQSRKSL
ncbi:MAG: putative nucleotide-diphospho-sugar transferase [Candidatus Omnitrophota bacterium]